MAKARAIVKRRKSVQNIRKITRTMELIATARFKKALDRATEAEAYTRKIAELVADLGQTSGEVTHPLLVRREPVGKALLLVLTSNRGLAGGYNGNVLRVATRAYQDARAEGVPVTLEVAGGLRLDLAAFRELEAFAQLGTELDKATQLQLDRGYRMVELLKQPQYQPMPAIDQVMSLYAGTEGYLDDVPIKEVSRWEAEFLRFMHEQKPDLCALVEREKKMTDAVVEGLKAALAEFKTRYRSAAAAKPAPALATAGA